MKYHTSIGIGWHQVPKITTIDISKVTNSQGIHTCLIFKTRIQKSQLQILASVTPIVKILIPA
jgi:hypothetical protein